MMKDKKLGKLKMPEKKDMEMAELDTESSDELPPEDADLAAEGDMVAEEMGPESNPQLEMISDDELLAELKKRGLSSQLDEMPMDDEAPMA
jgi:hypothetical protein